MPRRKHLGDRQALELAFGNSHSGNAAGRAGERKFDSYEGPCGKVQNAIVPPDASMRSDGTPESSPDITGPSVTKRRCHRSSAPGQLSTEQIPLDMLISPIEPENTSFESLSATSQDIDLEIEPGIEPEARYFGSLESLEGDEEDTRDADVIRCRCAETEEGGFMIQLAISQFTSGRTSLLPYKRPGVVTVSQTNSALSTKRRAMNSQTAKPLDGRHYKQRLTGYGKRGLCFRCLSSKHQAKECNITVTCEKCNNDRHQTILHLEKRKKEIGDNGEEVRTSCTGITNTECVSESCSKIVLVDVYAEKQPQLSHRVYAVLDEQSNASMISPDLADILGQTSPKENYLIHLQRCQGTETRPTSFGNHS
ncbi:hypothetical protein QZH41_009630 [Actinostola sp. cb2023]|nr:hypothetical protein QZH41_009630 [Actinostola sp. cb2023]